MTDNIRRLPIVATFAGLFVAAVGLVVQWIAKPAAFADFGFPPGLFYVVGAAVLVWLDRRANWSPMAAVILALWIVIGGLAGGILLRNLASTNAGTVAGNVVMVAGLAVTAVAGVLAIAHNRRTRPESAPRPLDRSNPRRLAALLTVIGLAVDAIGDAAPEGLNWDGPGPALFAILAVVVALVPGRAMIGLSMLLSLTFVLAAVAEPDSVNRLLNPADALPFGGVVAQILGLSLAVVAGTVAIAPFRRSNVVNI
ncbi:hypothetical protein [Actinocrispum wychmicini]|uniref:Uncharacterized protein n=1 Tax=Actinocrispum wychmicini TaxID=1213861 RepID=A0A4R2JY09_9PSEU|nr:hypothetical protein [Actinocrispum wychmicini]TCO62256.1 hypothetical protein EV192_102393 [Actinocrispum wychmicini]